MRKIKKSFFTLLEVLVSMGVFALLMLGSALPSKDPGDLAAKSVFRGACHGGTFRRGRGRNVRNVRNVC